MSKDNINANEQKRKEQKRILLNIGGMSCSFCTDSIKKAVGRLSGVSSVNVSLAHEEALVVYDEDRVSVDEIKSTLIDLGYTVRDPDRVKKFKEQQAEIASARRKLLLSAYIAVITLAFMLAMWAGYYDYWFAWLGMIFALTATFGPGLYIIKKSLSSLRRGILNQHVLLEFAVFAALTGGVLGFYYEEFPAFVFFSVAVFLNTYHILSGYISLVVRVKSSQAARRLMDLQPDTASVITDEGEQELPVEEVKAGDRVRIRPGEKVPVDGRIIKGSTTIDESLVTGESIPVDKEVGDEVIGGSINKSGAVTVEVTKIGDESFLKQIVHYIEEARALKPEIIQLMDIVLKYYVPGVLGFAGLAFLLWTLGSWLITGELQLIRAIFAVLAVLVMGYPCALGMAGPLAMIRGAGKAADKGILIRSGQAFEIFKDISTVFLDKTGTITRGEPEVTGIFPLQDYSAEKVLYYAASAELESQHPLGRAIVEEARQREIQLDEVQEFSSISGRGIRAKMEKQELLVGSLPFLLESEVKAGEEEKIQELESRGHTVIAVALDQKAIGLIAIADNLKEDAREAISQLKEAGMETVMLTGDGKETAEAVAEKAGLDRVLSRVLPQNKVEQIRKFQQEDKKVVMVGDGINDAPAITQADIGIAIGTGTDIALEASDIIIMGERLIGVVDSYHIGKKSYRKTRQNLILAFSFNGVGVPLAVTGLLHPAWAMVAMILSVSTVLVNSFLLGDLLGKNDDSQAD